MKKNLNNSETSRRDVKKKIKFNKKSYEDNKKYGSSLVNLIFSFEKAAPPALLCCCSVPLIACIFIIGSGVK